MGVPEHWLPKILWLNAIFIHVSRRNRADANDARDRFGSQLRAPLRRQSLHHLGSDRNTTMNITGYIRLPVQFNTFRQNIPEWTDDTGNIWHLISTQKYRSHVINEHTNSYNFISLSLFWRLPHWGPGE